MQAYLERLQLNMDLSLFIFNNSISILVKPNCAKNELVGYDKNKKAVKVNISAPADKDKANKEIIKYFSRLLKKKVRIKKGLRSREKVLELL